MGVSLRVYCGPSLCVGRCEVGHRAPPSGMERTASLSPSHTNAG
ncbi:2-oxoglutarate dehydrogenase, E2 component, dihydrolipoamide succinyltransferase, putative, partial [Trypanosoma cruzi]